MLHDVFKFYRIGLKQEQQCFSLTALVMFFMLI